MFADSVAEEGVDVGFCVEMIEVVDHAGGDGSSDPSLSSNRGR